MSDAHDAPRPAAGERQPHEAEGEPLPHEALTMPGLGELLARRRLPGGRIEERWTGGVIRYPAPGTPEHEALHWSLARLLVAWEREDAARAAERKTEPAAEAA